MGHYNQDKLSGNGDSAKGKGWLLGGLVPVGAGEIRASYSQYKVSEDDLKTNKLAIGYVHNLSKRTAVYTTYARLKNKGGADQALNQAQTGVNGKSSGLDVGIRHSF